MRRICVLSATMLALVVAGQATIIKAEQDDRTVVVTMSNAQANDLLVYDTAGALVQTVSTGGQGGVGGNAGGVATRNGDVAVVNFGSQTVSILARGENGFAVKQTLATVSAPVSVAYGKGHLYVLGTTTVESHRIAGSGIDASPDGVSALLLADGSAAQVGVSADQLVISEKTGVIEVFNLQSGAVQGQPASVALPADSRNTPFGLVTRGANAYVTIAHSDLISLIKNGQLVALAATGSNFPSGPGQQAPCWITLDGQFLFTSDSPSHAISRLVATGHSITLDQGVAAKTVGAPIDIASEGDLVALIESNDAQSGHVTLFNVDDEGNLKQVSTTAIASPANGVAIVSE